MSEHSVLSRIITNLPEIMNTRIPGLDILDMRLSLPERWDKLLPSRKPINGIPKVPARSSTRGVLATFVREGVLHEGMKAPFSICGKDFFIYDNAWILGEVRVGLRARVTGVVRKGDMRFATKIQVLGGSEQANPEVDGDVNQLN